MAACPNHAASDLAPSDGSGDAASGRALIGAFADHLRYERHLALDRRGPSEGPRPVSPWQGGHGMSTARLDDLRRFLAQLTTPGTLARRSRGGSGRSTPFIAGPEGKA